MKVKNEGILKPYQFRKKFLYFKRIDFLKFFLVAWQMMMWSVASAGIIFFSFSWKYDSLSGWTSCKSLLSFHVKSKFGLFGMWLAFMVD